MPAKRERHLVHVWWEVKEGEGHLRLSVSFHKNDSYPATRNEPASGGEIEDIEVSHVGTRLPQDEEDRLIADKRFLDEVYEKAEEARRQWG